jgi:signal transduction histidine kinase
VGINFSHNVLTVRDSGPGIAEIDLPHIFDRFYRAESSRTSDGYGLGLSLAKHLADKLHVNIRVDNVVENGHISGAVFSVDFTR